MLIIGLRTSEGLTRREEDALRRLPMRVQSIASRKDVIVEGDRPAACCLIVEGFFSGHKSRGRQVSWANRLRLATTSACGRRPRARQVWKRQRRRRVYPAAACRCTEASGLSTLARPRLGPTFSSPSWARPSLLSLLS